MKKNIPCLIVLLLGVCTQLNAQNNISPWPATGNVGIGTGCCVAPPYALVITAPSAQTLSINPHLYGVDLHSTGNFAPHYQTNFTVYHGNIGSGVPMLDINASGNIGIGTIAQTEKLQVAGNILSMGTLFLGVKKDDVGYGQRIDFDNYGNYDPLWLSRYNVASDASELRVNIGDDGGAADAFAVGYISWDGSGWHPRMTVRADGQVGIGTASVNDGTYKLYVETGIRTRKIKVDQSTWADYVFNNSYTLRPLSEVEGFIKKYQHLPDVPSAAEVAKDGIDLGANQAVLLKKIEELTLYLIEQKKEIELLKEENKKADDMQKRLKILEEALERKDAYPVKL